MEYTLNGNIYKETRFVNYFISKDGEVAQIKFFNNRLKSFFLMRQELTKDGYCRVEINNKHYLVHRLVYETWSGDKLNPELVIDHMDANPQNNNIDNLRQVTQLHNIENAIQHGNFGHNHNTKIKIINTETDESKIYNSVKDFYIEIDAPKYIINNGGLAIMNKRKEYSKYHVIKINEH